MRQPCVCVMERTQDLVTRGMTVSPSCACVFEGKKRGGIDTCQLQLSQPYSSPGPPRSAELKPHTVFLPHTIVHAVPCGIILCM